MKNRNRRDQRRATFGRVWRMRPVRREAEFAKLMAIVCQIPEWVEQVHGGIKAAFVQMAAAIAEPRTQDQFTLAPGELPRGPQSGTRATIPHELKVAWANPAPVSMYRSDDQHCKEDDL